MMEEAPKELGFVFFHNREIKYLQWNKKVGKSILRSENISYAISSEALLESTVEAKSLSRSVTSKNMHKGIEILVLEHNCWLLNS